MRTSLHSCASFLTIDTNYFLGDRALNLDCVAALLNNSKHTYETITIRFPRITYTFHLLLTKIYY